MSKLTHSWSPAALLAMVCLMLAACSDKPNVAPTREIAAKENNTGKDAGKEGGEKSAAKDAAKPAGPAGGAPVSVTTVVARTQDFPVILTANGVVTATSSVDIKPQLSATIASVHFTEGQSVAKGQPLFTLDARNEQANLARAQAQLAKDQAALADAQRQLARSRELFAKGFVSQGAIDASQTNVDSQSALVAADRAAADAARVALSYSRIVAPSAGRAGAVAVFAGSTVQANQTTLVTITQIDPVHVSFGLPQSVLADVMAAQKDKAVVTVTAPNAKARVEGYLRFVDNQVDAASGTIKLKAELPNRDSVLWPGAFINVALTARVLKAAVVIPQAAVIQTARGSIVYVVKDGKAERRPIEIVQPNGAEVAVKGVADGEVIVLDGRQNVRPDSAVIERTGEAGKAAKGDKAEKPEKAEKPTTEGAGAAKS